MGMYNREYLLFAERILFVYHLNAIIPSLRRFASMWGIRRPAGCHDGDAHNQDRAWHGIINEVLVVACDLGQAPLCRSMFIKNTREFSASLLYLLFLFLILISFCKEW